MDAALELWVDAAARGHHGRCDFALAVLYHHGRGVGQDFERAKVRPLLVLMNLTLVFMNNTGGQDFERAKVRLYHTRWKIQSAIAASTSAMTEREREREMRVEEREGEREKEMRA